MTTRTLAKVVCLVSLALMAAYPATNSYAQEMVKTFTELIPPYPAPPGVSPNGHGVAVVETQAGIRERLSVEIQDVEVIGDAADPEFCKGFYVVILTNVERTVYYEMPAFAGIIATCDVAGDPQGPTRGSLNIDIRLDKGQMPFDFRGKMICVWEVEPVRDPVTGVAVKGPNGEPFVVKEQKHISLWGVLSSLR